MKAHWLHGILSRVSAWRPGASPLTKHPPRLTSLGAELPHPIQSPELLGPGPLRRQSAASLWLSHHGFLQLLQHLRRYVCPRSLGSDQFPRGGGLWCGRGSVDSPARGSRQTCRLTAKKARDRSAGPLVSRRQVCPERHRLVVWLAWHTHGFSFLFSVMMLLVVWPGGGRGTGMGPYFLILPWKWTSGSSVALPTSVAFCPKWPRAFCLPSGVACWASLRLPSLSFPLALVTTNMAWAPLSPEKPGSPPLAL